MIGALMVLCMAYAVHHAWGFGPNPNAFKHMTVEQMEYMAEVRVRNTMNLEREGRWARGDARRREGETVY